MHIEEAKQLLTSRGFEVREGYMCLIIGEHEVKEPIIGVDVSDSHQCFDQDCGPVHVVGTKLAIELMQEQALREVIDELASNR